MNTPIPMPESILQEARAIAGIKKQYGLLVCGDFHHRMADSTRNATAQGLRQQDQSLRLGNLVFAPTTGGMDCIAIIGKGSPDDHYTGWIIDTTGKASPFEAKGISGAYREITTRLDLKKLRNR